MAIYVRRAAPDDSVGIGKLITDCYGLDCSDTNMYDSAALYEKIRDKRTEIYLAFDGEKIVSMEVLDKSERFPNTVYLKNKMTRKDYRGRGIAAQVAAVIFEYLDTTDYISAFAFALTYNDLSQQILVDNGFFATGLAFNSFLKSENVPDNNNPIPKRSHCIMVKRLSYTSVGRLYLPQEIQPFAKKIYSKFGTQPEFDSSIIPADGKMVFQNIYDSHHQNCELIINEVGSDLYEIVDGVVQSKLENPLQTFNLFLNIADRSAVWGYNLLYKYGFHFTGLKPLGNGREYAILYFSTSVKPQIEYITLHPKFSEIKQEIKIIQEENL